MVFKWAEVSWNLDQSDRRWCAFKEPHLCCAGALKLLLSTLCKRPRGKPVFTLLPSLNLPVLRTNRVTHRLCRSDISAPAMQPSVSGAGFVKSWPRFPGKSFNIKPLWGGFPGLQGRSELGFNQYIHTSWRSGELAANSPGTSAASTKPARRG